MRDPRGAVLLAGVFVISLLSSSYVWQARDWNGSSRLMLTYSLADRGLLTINGLEDHTHDRARIGWRYYSDKLPGFSILAIPPYLFARHVVGIPAHPLNRPGQGFTHWPADYWITLGTSALATALTAAMLAGFALRIGCGPKRAIIVGLAYALGTPAYVYGTLNYGHQVTACCLLGSFLLIDRGSGSYRSVGAGFLAALAATVELQVAPVSAIVGLYLLVLVGVRRRSASAPATFAIGALVPLAALLIYNVLAFGSPLDMGYFHEDLRQFREVHSGSNPLGLRRPDLAKLPRLLWGEHRGLVFYAPIVLLAPPGWGVWAVRRCWGLLSVSLSACVAVLTVNLCYPEWTGGWSTGPRLLLPLLPFAMLPVAGLLAVGGRLATTLAVILGLIGWILVTSFLGVGGRVPPEIDRPMRDFVWPAWRGDPMVGDAERFARNLASINMPESLARLPEGWSWLQWAPLIAAQVLATGLLIVACQRLMRPSSPGDRAESGGARPPSRPVRP
jgi:hypothetical protein